MPRKRLPTLADLDFYQDFAESLATHLRDLDDSEPTVLDFYDRYLQLGVALTVPQRLVLKLYYGLPLQGEDLLILDRWAAENRIAGLPDLDTPKERLEALEALVLGKPHQYLVMEAGRRAGKSLMAGVVVAYEFFRLCRLPDPQGHYGIAKSSPITILVMATTAQQGARTVYRQVQGTIQACPYLVQLAQEGRLLIGQEEISYRDKALYIHAGNSRSGSQVGQNLLLLVMDEVARFENEAGEKNALELWRNLGVSGATFGAHAKRVAISSAWYEGDAIQQLYQQAATSPIMLGLRLRSWDLNPVHAARDNPLVAEEYRLDPVQAALEFEGIRPVVTDAFFNAAEVRRACRGQHAVDATRHIHQDLVVLQVTPRSPTTPQGGYGYVAHLDPAVRRDAFALVVGHNHWSETGDLTVVMDVVLAWEPDLQHQVCYSNVYDVLRVLHAAYPLELVTIDTVTQATEVVQRLRDWGIRCEVTPFTNNWQVLIYAHLRQLLHEDRLVLPQDSPWTPLLVRELTTVQLHRGTKIIHPPHGSKDLADAVAAVAHQLARRQHLDTTPVPVPPARRTHRFGAARQRWFARTATPTTPSGWRRWGLEPHRR